jgi:transposase
MSISEHKHVSEVVSGPAQRLEVFTGAGRRRSWTSEKKASIVAESFVEGATACQVARRHGLTPQQLFTWRREVRRRLAASGDIVPRFVPAVVDPPPKPAGKRGKPRSRRRGDALGVIEVEIDGVTVRVGRGAETKTVAAVLRALKASA